MSVFEIVLVLVDCLSGGGGVGTSGDYAVGGGGGIGSKNVVIGGVWINGIEGGVGGLGIGEGGGSR